MRGPGFCRPTQHLGRGSRFGGPHNILLPSHQHMLPMTCPASTILTPTHHHMPDTSSCITIHCHLHVPCHHHHMPHHPHHAPSPPPRLPPPRSPSGASVLNPQQQQHSLPSACSSCAGLPVLDWDLGLLPDQELPALDISNLAGGALQPALLSALKEDVQLRER